MHYHYKSYFKCSNTKNVSLLNIIDFIIDPDAPCQIQPTLGEWLHWLVVNVPGNRTSEGEVLADYIGSGPPEGSGK